MSQPDFDLQATIARLYVYPVKSCAGVELHEALLIETGLEFDRAWMVVDAAGEFVTQRELPRMALIRPKLKHHEMVLRAPGMLALHIALDAVEEPVRVTVWDDEVAAYDMGDIAAQWFSDFLGRPSCGWCASTRAAAPVETEVDRRRRGAEPVRRRLPAARRERRLAGRAERAAGGRRPRSGRDRALPAQHRAGRHRGA